MSMAENNGASNWHIEHGVPLPDRKSKVSKTKEPRAHKYPFRLMVPGDSVLLTGLKSNQVTSALGPVRKVIKGSKWVTRTQDNGVRVWRTA